MPSRQEVVDLDYAGTELRCTGIYHWDRADSVFELRLIESPTNTPLAEEFTKLTESDLTWEVLEAYCVQKLDTQYNWPNEPFAGYKQGE